MQARLKLTFTLVLFVHVAQAFLNEVNSCHVWCAIQLRLVLGEHPAICTPSKLRLHLVHPMRQATLICNGCACMTGSEQQRGRDHNAHSTDAVFACVVHISGRFSG